MYVRVLQDELQFPEDKAMDQDTKSLIRGVRDLGAQRTWELSDFIFCLQSFCNGTQLCVSRSRG